MPLPIKHESVVAMYDSYAKTVIRNCYRNIQYYRRKALSGDGGIKGRR
jgi:hypothetical protein